MPKVTCKKATGKETAAMKFLAELEIRENEEFLTLIQSFFENFNPQSRICINGNNAKVEVVFDDKPPLSLIEAVCKCKIKSFVYGEVTQKEGAEPEETETLEEEAVEAEKTENFEQETNEPEDAGVTAEKTTEAAAYEQEEESFKKFAEDVSLIASQSETYSKFIDLLAESLDLQKERVINYFKELIFAANQANKLNFVEINQFITSEKTSYVDKLVREKISAKYPKLSLLRFLKVIKEYKECFVTAEDTSKITCMPFIPEFEKALDEMKPNLSIEGKVNRVLVLMGIEEEEDLDKERIRKIVYSLIYSKNSSREEIETAVSPESRMLINRFVNQFISKHGIEEKVKAIDFLFGLMNFIF